MQKPPPGTPARQPSTNLVPSFTATSSAALAPSPSAGFRTGRPTASQPRKPPERIPTRCLGSAFSRYQLAHCGARWAEYWHVKITRLWSAHLFTNLGTLVVNGTVSMAGSCTAPSIRPEALSSPRRSTRMHCLPFNSSCTRVGSMCSTSLIVGTVFGRCGGTYAGRPACTEPPAGWVRLSPSVCSSSCCSCCCCCSACATERRPPPPPSCRMSSGESVRVGGGGGAA
mmetsp:Transcript_37538/g.116770  ORF Transcript_37538/g.116770 Transcript_37538/m.116770 type:complete len:227 (-) Transcript_37538:163-843(-)